MIKMSIFNKTNDVLIVDAFNQKCLSKKKQRNTSIGCPVGPDNPEVYASLLTEHHRMHVLVGLLQTVDKGVSSENDQSSTC